MSNYLGMSRAEVERIHRQYNLPAASASTRALISRTLENYPPRPRASSHSSASAHGGHVEGLDIDDQQWLANAMAASEKKADLASLRERVRDEPSRSKRNELRAKIRKLEAEIKSDEEQEDETEPRPTRDRENDEEARPMQKRQKAYADANATSLAQLKREVPKQSRRSANPLAKMLGHLGTDPARAFHEKSSEGDLEALASLPDSALVAAGLKQRDVFSRGSYGVGLGAGTPAQAREAQQQIQKAYGGLLK